MEFDKPTKHDLANEGTGDISLPAQRPVVAYPAQQVLEELKIQWEERLTGETSEEKLSHLDNIRIIVQRLKEMTNKQASLNSSQSVYVIQTIEDLASDSETIQLQVGEGTWKILLLGTFINSCRAQDNPS